MKSSKTWPSPSSTARFSTLPAPRIHHNRRPDPSKKKRIATPSRSPRCSVVVVGGGPSSPDASPGSSFTDLPFDVLARIAASFDVPDLWAASTVCRPWRDALRPLREAMVLLRWGKKFKHGHGVRPDPARALESFLKGAARGSAAAMVDAGLMYWEMGMKEKGRELYRRAAELGYPAGQCNLGICYLEADPPELEEAVKWFCLAANSGSPRAQYNLALCLHRGRGVLRNLRSAGRWYMRAAEGGNARAMYNTSLCYASGEGLPRDLQRAKMWMKCAADYGHRKAQFEHGLERFSAGDMMKALVYLELAARAGDTAASHLRNVAFESLSQSSRDRAMSSVDRWKPHRSHR